MSSHADGLLGLVNSVLKAGLSVQGLEYYDIRLYWGYIMLYRDNEK